jgi:hypothetical protein
MADEKIQPQEAFFPNNDRAKIVAAPLGASASSVIEALGISAPKNLIYCYRSRTGVYSEDLCSVTVCVS